MPDDRWIAPQSLRCVTTLEAQAFVLGVLPEAGVVRRVGYRDHLRAGTVGSFFAGGLAEQRQGVTKMLGVGADPAHIEAMADMALERAQAAHQVVETSLNCRHIILDWHGLHLSGSVLTVTFI